MSQPSQGSLPAAVKHPIRVVTNRTGLSPDLLRAWERRYGVVEPTRSPGGQRLYSDADIDRLRLLHRATHHGRSISSVAALTPAALAALVRADEALERGVVATLPEPTAAAIDGLLDSAMKAIRLLDPVGLERVLKRASIQLSVPLLLEGFLAPLLWRVGDHWETGDLRPAHEHLASAEVRRLLVGMVDLAAVEPEAPTIVVATPAGQLIELGALMAATSAAAEGWRVVYFGTDLPASEIAAAVRTTKARAVAISLSHESRDPRLRKELELLAKSVRGHATLLVGGRAAAVFALLMRRLGAKIFRDLESLRLWLRSAG